MNKIKYVFFGSSHFSTLILDALESAGLTPALIVTVLDKPKGRKLVLTPPEAKTWADQKEIPCLQLGTLRTPEAEEKIRSFAPDGFDVGIVASYGKIIPQNILDIPKRETLNVHPSLLPLLRGASPLQSAILSENETGVSIIHLDADMDHGPIVAQEKLQTSEWPPYMEDLEKSTAEIGAKLLIGVLSSWVDGTCPEVAQEHTKATFCTKIEKENGELCLEGDPLLNLRKIRAYHLWPGAYFFFEHQGKKMRMIVRRAKIENNTLVLERVVPEGKKEMNYTDFLNGFKNK